jgi:hypothetical protein
MYFSGVLLAAGTDTEKVRSDSDNHAVSPITTFHKSLQTSFNIIPSFDHARSSQVVSGLDALLSKSLDLTQSKNLGNHR